MPGFVFLSRKVELLGVKIIFLRNVLPVLNFSKDETFLKENWSNCQRKKYTVNTIPFQIYSIVFSPCINWRLRCSVLLPFFFNLTEKGFFFIIRIICGPFWESFAVSGSFAVGDHLRYCTVPNTVRKIGKYRNTVSKIDEILIPHLFSVTLT